MMRHDEPHKVGGAPIAMAINYEEGLAARHISSQKKNLPRGSTQSCSVLTPWPSPGPRCPPGSRS